MKHLFKTHGKKTIKAPIIPQEKPKLGKRKIGKYQPVDFPFKYIPEPF